MPSTNHLFFHEPVEGTDPLYVANVLPPKGANINSTEKISEDKFSSLLKTPSWKKRPLLRLWRTCAWRHNPNL